MLARRIAAAAGAHRAPGTTEQGFELRGFEEREPYAVKMLMKMPPRTAPGEGGACDGEAAPRVVEGVLGG